MQYLGAIHRNFEVRKHLKSGYLKYHGPMTWDYATVLCHSPMPRSYAMVPCHGPMPSLVTTVRHTKYNKQPFQGSPRSSHRHPQEHVRVAAAALHLHARLQGGRPAPLHPNRARNAVTSAKREHCFRFNVL